jgi:hypothetical protein
VFKYLDKITDVPITMGWAGLVTRIGERVRDIFGRIA